MRTERTQSATGLGDLTLAVTDMSDLTSWSGISAVPLQVSLAVPSGEQFDNVNVTAEVNTNADYLNQPYYRWHVAQRFFFRVD